LQARENNYNSTAITADWLYRRYRNSYCLIKMKTCRQTSIQTSRTKFWLVPSLTDSVVEADGAVYTKFLGLLWRWVAAAISSHAWLIPWEPQELGRNCKALEMIPSSTQLR